jgi:hypothetical protein
VGQNVLYWVSFVVVLVVSMPLMWVARKRRLIGPDGPAWRDALVGAVWGGAF